MTNKSEILNRLNKLLDIAREAFDDEHYTFKRSSYLGSMWLDTMELVCNESGTTLKKNSLKSLVKTTIIVDVIDDLKDVKSYFDPNGEAWKEKVRSLFLEKKEEKFNNACYELSIGSQLKQGEKKLWFCNMESNGQNETKSLCEYFLEENFFVECKDLSGVGKSAIDGSIRKANRQIKSSMEEINSTAPLGITFMNLSKKISVNNENELNEKVSIALNRFKQCQSTHFLAITFQNIIGENGKVSFYLDGKLIINPQYINCEFLDPKKLMFLYPRFRSVLIPHANDTFDIFDFKDLKDKTNVRFEEVFGFEN